MTEETEKKATGYVKSALPLIYLIIALFALRWSVVEPYVVPTGSMEPTLKPGDRLYALKCAYDVRFPFSEKILFKTGTVKRGDIILFRAPLKPDVTYVKRAVGIPGDRIRFQDGVLYVNDQEIQKSPLTDRSIMYDIEYRDDKSVYIEDFLGVKHYVILDNERPNKRNMPEITVPDGHYFAVGDNRDNSYDGRSWGDEDPTKVFVPAESLKGRAIFIWYSSVDFKPRLERIGTLLQ
jgi:signal peptidase I